MAEVALRGVPDAVGELGSRGGRGLLVAGAAGIALLLPAPSATPSMSPSPTQSKQEQKKQDKQQSTPAATTPAATPTPDEPEPAKSPRDRSEPAPMDPWRRFTADSGAEAT